MTEPIKYEWALRELVEKYRKHPQSNEDVADILGAILDILQDHRLDNEMHPLLRN